MGGKKLIDPAFDSTKLTSFTRGLANHARRNVHRIPGAIRRLKAAPELYHRQFGACDVVLSPTVSDPAPTLAYLGKDLDYQTHMDRLMRWAAYTPLHNVVGAPGISLPVALDLDLTLPVGVHLAARVGQERLLLELALQVEEARSFPKLSDFA